MIIGREEERKVIREFLVSHLSPPRGGFLYIAGASGTGKTACVTHVFEELEGVLRSSSNRKRIRTTGKEKTPPLQEVADENKLFDGCNVKDVLKNVLFINANVASAYSHGILGKMSDAFDIPLKELENWFSCSTTKHDFSTSSSSSTTKGVKKKKQ